MTEPGPPTVARLEGVSKRFPLYQRVKGGGSLKGSLLRAFWDRSAVDPARTVGVLEEVDLELRRGDFLALLGANGSGKSTLLKLLAGIYRPDAGSVRTRGRLGSLLELGTGFHPDFTGRENALVNGALLGLRLRDVERRLPEIVEFSGLGAKIDAPVRSYSSGMIVRLGFSVAVHVRPVLLLVDEVLAVGDHSFRAKGLAKIRELRSEGTTILFVSHDVDLVRELATRAAVLEGARLVETRSVEEAVERYLALGVDEPGAALPEVSA